MRKERLNGVCDRSQRFDPSGDRKILSERLNLSADQQKYIDNSEPGEGLLIFENVVLPFSNPIPNNTQLYKIMTTRLSEVVEL